MSQSLPLNPLHTERVEKGGSGYSEGRGEDAGVFLKSL